MIAGSAFHPSAVDASGVGRLPTPAEATSRTPQVAVVIPAYKVTRHVLAVIAGVGPEVARIYVVDDCCPDGSGALVERECTDGRVRVVRHAVNRGVGGAVMTGYRSALDDGMDVIVKVDGDGQMDPRLVPAFVSPILGGEADYTKGNRFFDIEAVRAMPRVRLIGNTLLSFLTKLSSGYWDLFDPTNGYTAIHADVARQLPFDKLSERYFFETDILFRLNTLRAAVVDIPIEATYNDEVSSLSVTKVIPEFAAKHLRNFVKRIFYNYYLRDLSLASIELPLGVLLLCFGTVFGGYHWIASMRSGVATPAGTVMVAAVPVLMGLQFLMAFLGYDIATVPRRPVSSLRWRFGHSGDRS